MLTVGAARETVPRGRTVLNCLVGLPYLGQLIPAGEVSRCQKALKALHRPRLVLRINLAFGKQSLLGFEIAQLLLTLQSPDNPLVSVFIGFNP